MKGPLFTKFFFLSFENISKTDAESVLTHLLSSAVECHSRMSKVNGGGEVSKVNAAGLAVSTA